MKTSALVTMSGLLLIGCAMNGAISGDDKNRDTPSGDDKYRRPVPLSQEVTRELSKPFGASPPKIVFAVNSEGNIVVFQPAGAKLVRVLEDANARLNVGNLVGPPAQIVIMRTAKSPDEVRVCRTTASGWQECYSE